MLDRFDYDTYAGILTTLMRQHRNVCFDELPLSDRSARYFLLRHDIDMSPEAGLRMAKLEAELGIRATYFFLFSSPFYNLLSEEYCSYPRRLLDLGHAVGLHYDVRAYATLADADPLAVLKGELTLLGRLAGREIRAIAMHNPSINGVDPFRDTPGLHNAYAAEHTEHATYWSDSCGAWRDDFVNTWKAGVLPPRIQLLIHPMFWNDDAQDRWTCQRRLLDDQIGRLRTAAEDIRSGWLDHQGVDQHERRLAAEAGRAVSGDTLASRPTP